MRTSLLPTVGNNFGFWICDFGLKTGSRQRLDERQPAAFRPLPKLPLVHRPNPKSKIQNPKSKIVEALDRRSLIYQPADNSAPSNNTAA
jgi:hypothetical protein